MMKKIIVAILLGLISLSSLFAGVWFSPYPASFGIDLADTFTYCGLDTTDASSVEFEKTQGYNDNTLVALLGITETNIDTEVTISFPPDDSAWVYTSASQPDAKREYEIYLIERRRYEYEYDKEYQVWPPDFIPVYRTVDYTESVVKLSHSSLSDYQDFSFPPTNKTETKQLYGVTKDGGNATGYLIGCWIDIVIALPDISEQEQGITTSPADDYSSELDVILTGGVSGQYHLEFTGFYGDDPGDRGSSVLFNVIPDPVNASTIVLDDLTNSSYVEIGRYSYTTTIDQAKKENEATNDYYIFASASDEPTKPNADGFVLRLQGTDKTSKNERITVPYTITLVTDSHGIDSDRSVEFDGTDYLSGNTLTKGLESLDRHESQIGSDGTLHSYYDNGSILFKLASKVNEDYINNLISGVYESRVYFHVVSKW